MHLLYADESGSISDPAHVHFVLAGISVGERKCHWIEQEINAIAERFADPSSSDYVELHGSAMRSGRDGWKKHLLEDRLQAIDDALTVIVNAGNAVRVFGAILNKQGFQGEDCVEAAFEMICRRFDSFLTRCYTRHQDPQRGLIIFDKSSTERRIQSLAKDFKYKGHTWGQTRNYADVPVFMDSKASRLIQLADLVAFSIFRKFEYNDSRWYDIISSRVDRDGSIMQGLIYHMGKQSAFP